ncbi:MAG: hypothetical protein GX574_04440 [Lentisphaerae bacterium]|nr:hypothetical protein [Lentisphaerota bacterium]HQL87139.1 hypothetical protein [Lentisphaeria bacterium]
MYKVSLRLASFFLCLALSATADILVVGGKEVAGVFSGFEKKRVLFQEWQKDTPDKYDIAQVERLRLDRPMRVSFAYSKDIRRKLPGVLHGFKGGEFDLEENGKRIKVPNWKLARVEATVDMQDFMLRREAAMNPEAGEGGKNSYFEVEKVLKPGQALVVHFHQHGSAASERQGNYIRRLCENSRGKAIYHQVKVAPDPDDPNIRRYELKTLPQFWFYTPKGELSQRLAERFTESDLEKALESARRAR